MRRPVESYTAAIIEARSSIAPLSRLTDIKWALIHHNQAQPVKLSELQKRGLFEAITEEEYTLLKLSNQ